jgi:hypothetical protein
MPEVIDYCKQRKDYQWDPEGNLRSGDYTYARTRARFRKQRGRHPERGYDIARHFMQVIADRRRDQGHTLTRLFHEHVERWKNETGHLSSVTRMTVHPSYLRIIAFGQEGLPMILKELKERPDHWLVALNAITGEDPASEGATFREAVAAWIKWGESRGFC